MSDSVRYLRDEYKALDAVATAKKSGGDPPGGDGLEKRVEKLESTMADIQVRLIRVESKLDSTATKADLSELATVFHKSMNEQTWKFLAAATGMAGLFSVIAFGLARSLS
ncbi:hypothetical protein JTA33_00425 [Pseudomonas sp. 20GA0080]|uniref:hypothetical protein n=1 Tax=Pseudomonas alliivorans TaxID=2810613 RepID=UPI001AE9A11F|nr:hypothetical protein [Pseudomonas alliivorans]MBP0948913.1 hypothetical protein [Pseudomonas alliivorans]